MLLKKKATIAMLCFILILGLVYGSTAGNVHAHTNYECNCTLDSVTIEHDGQFYNASETTYFFDANATEFLVTSFSSMITLKDSQIMVDGGELVTLTAIHSVNSYYSFDDSNDSGWTRIYDIVDFSVPVGDNNDLYFKFVLDADQPKDTQAAYMHFARTSGVESISADPSTLPSSGGNVNVTVSGGVLPSGLEVRVYDVDGNDLGIVSQSNKDITAKSVKAVSETYTVSLPANTTDEDKMYVIRAAVNGDWFEPSATVTVLAQADDDVTDNQDEKGSSGGKTGDDRETIIFILLGLGAALVLSLALLVNRICRKKELI